MSIAKDFLAHYGIPGMKWGVRRGRGAARRAANESDDYKSVKPLRRKKPRELSNDQLKALTERLNLENSLKEATAKQKGRGKKFLENLPEKTANQVVGAVIGSATSLAIQGAINAAKKK